MPFCAHVMKITPEVSSAMRAELPYLTNSSSNATYSGPAKSLRARASRRRASACSLASASGSVMLGLVLSALVGGRVGGSGKAGSLFLPRLGRQRSAPNETDFHGLPGP